MILVIRFIETLQATCWERDTRKLQWWRGGYQSCASLLLAISQLVRWILKPCVGAFDWSQLTWLRSHLEINKTFLDAICLLLLFSNARGKYQGDYFNLLSSLLCLITHNSLVPCSQDCSLGVGLAALIHTYPSPCDSQYPGAWIEIRGRPLKAHWPWPQGHNLSLLSQETQLREDTKEYTEEKNKTAGDVHRVTRQTLII